MAKKYKKQTIKHGKLSMMPRTLITDSMASNMNKMAEWPGRVAEGRRLLALEMAGICRKRVEEKAPKIDGQNYARELKVGLVSGVDDIEMVALYFKDVKRKFKEKDSKDSLLIIKSHSRSPDYVPVLQKYGPWPAEIMPIKLDVGDATVIRRKMRPDESKRIKTRILSRRVEIENRLKASGAKEVKISPGNNASEVEVHDDVGYAVLRKEFGFEGKQEAHWRPAIKSLQAEMPRLLAKFVQYIKTGRETVFDLPDNQGISEAEFQRGKWFQDKIT